MSLERTSKISRRRLLRSGSAIAGISTAGNLLSTSSVSAQDASASVTFNDQSTDGTTLTVAEVSTPVEARLLLVSGTSTVYKEKQLDAGDEFTDLTLSLSLEVADTTTIRAEVRSPFPEDELLAQSRALVTVGENPEAVGLRMVDANSQAGFNYPYFLYVPSASDDREVSLLVEPNNTGTGTDDFAKHRQKARQLIKGPLSQMADQLGVPALVPVFPRPNEHPVDWRHYTHQLDRDTLAIEDGPLERVDRQLLNMVDHAIESELAETDYTIRDDIMLNGFSASGNFSDRFTVLHADRVRSVTAGGLNGMALLPLEEAKGHTLTYHVGIADVNDLIGEPVDLDALADTNQFLYMGENDSNDTIPYDDAWTSDERRQVALDVYGDDMLEDRFPYSQQAYEQAGGTAQFRIYQGIGHRPPQLEDIMEFHRRTLEGESVSEYGTDVSDEPAGYVVTDSPSPAFELSAAHAIIGDEVGFDASPTERGDTSIVAYQWDFGDGTEATGEAVTHTFSEGGTYSIELTVEDFFGRTVSETKDLVVSQPTTTQPTAEPTTTSPVETAGTDGSPDSTRMKTKTTTGSTASGFSAIAALASGAGLLLRHLWNRTDD